MSQEEMNQGQEKKPTNPPSSELLARVHEGMPVSRSGVRAQPKATDLSPVLPVKYTPESEENKV